MPDRFGELICPIHCTFKSGTVLSVTRPRSHQFSIHIQFTLEKLGISVPSSGFTISKCIFIHPSARFRRSLKHRQDESSTVQYFQSQQNALLTNCLLGLRIHLLKGPLKNDLNSCVNVCFPGDTPHLALPHRDEFERNRNPLNTAATKTDG